MKNKLIVKLPFILMALIVTFFSCEKNLDEIEIQPEVSTEISKDFSVNDGYLIFSSTESFTKTVNIISAFSKEERLNWEKQNGFLSQKTIIDNIIDEEIACYDAIKEKFKNKKIEEINKRDLHSNIYNKYLDNGVIKLIDEDTKDEYWNHSVYNPIYLSFINEAGFYSIADTLYQVTEKGLIAFKNNKPEIIKDNSSKIYSNIIWSTWEGSSSNRAIMGVNLEVIGLNYYPEYHYYFWHQIFIYNQIRTWYGAWMYTTRGVDFQGNWDIQAFKYPVYLTGNTSGYQFGSQIVLGINPETGWVRSPESVFSIWSQNYSLSDHLYRPKYNRYYWQAIVHIDTPVEHFDIELELTKY